jgi:hypothetical protein
MVCKLLAGHLGDLLLIIELLVLTSVLLVRLFAWKLLENKVVLLIFLHFQLFLLLLKPDLLLSLLWLGYMGYLI